MYKKRCFRGKNRFFSRSLCSKRGQVTIFMIIGILLLLGLIIYIALQRELIVFKPEELLPIGKGKIENLITSCITDIGEGALTEIGLKGGYLNVPAEISFDGNRNLRISPMHSIPYWAYGQVKEHPSLSDIKLDLDNHIEENLRDCVFGLKQFNFRFFIFFFLT